jgi:hypothetical protein
LKKEYYLLLILFDQIILLGSSIVFQTHVAKVIVVVSVRVVRFTGVNPIDITGTGTNNLIADTINTVGIFS